MLRLLPPLRLINSLLPRLLSAGVAVWAIVACSAASVQSPQSQTDVARAGGSGAAQGTRADTAPSSTAVELITIVAAGDIMPGSLTPIPFVPEPSEHAIPEEIRRTMPPADLVFGNLEGSFTVDGIAPTKCRPESREAGRCYEFGFPPYLVSFLKEAGFTVLSLDNNHSDDYGPPGYVLTQGLLAQAGLMALPKRTPVVLEVRNVAVALVPFGFSGRSFHVSDLETARTIVAEASRTADVVIVSFHGGAEGESASRVMDVAEEYYGEDRGNVLQFAHAVIDAGADLVVGHGPHVPRAIELYGDRLIAYSLGNFWTYGNISIKGVKSIMPLLSVTLARDGTFRSGRLISMRQRLPGIPELDPENTASRLIAVRSHEDLAANPLRISETGELWIQPTDEHARHRIERCDRDVSSGCNEAGWLRTD